MWKLYQDRLLLCSLRIGRSSVADERVRPLNLNIVAGQIIKYQFMIPFPVSGLLSATLADWFFRQLMLSHRCAAFQVRVHQYEFSG